MVLNHETGSSRPPHSVHPGMSPGQGLERTGAPPECGGAGARAGTHSYSTWSGGSSGWSLGGPHSPPAAGGFPSATCGWPWDPLSSPTARGSHGSELRSSTRPEAAGAAVVRKGWRLPTGQTIRPLRPGVRVMQGGTSTRTPRGPAMGGRGRGGRRDPCPLNFRKAWYHPDQRLLLQVCQRISWAFRGTPHPALSLVPLRELSERC